MNIMENPMLLAAVGVVVLLILLALRARNNKKSEPRASHRKPAPASKSKAIPVKEPLQPATPQVDTSAITRQVTDLVDQDDFEKAEALINVSLNRDPHAHALYPLLLDLYQKQDNQLAINRLFETVQRLNLNTVYQQLTLQQDQFISAQQIEHEQAERRAAEQAAAMATTATVVESSDALQSYDTLSHETSTDIAVPPIAGSIDHPEVYAPSTVATHNTLEFDSVRAATPEVETLEFTPSNLQRPAPAASTDAPIVDQLTFAPPVPAETTTPVAPSELTFELTPTEPPAQTPVSELTFAPLDEVRSTPVSVDPTVQSPSALDFHLGQPADQVTSIPAHVDTPFPPAVILPEEPKQPQVPQEPALQDPLLLAFPQLTEVDPLVLNIQLAEHYIRLGEYEAAKQLLIEHEANGEHRQQVDALLQKIA